MRKISETSVTQIFQQKETTKISNFYRHAVSNKELRHVLLKSVVHGHLPLGYVDNTGIRTIITHFAGSIPRGISRRQVSRDLVELYEEKKKEKAEWLLSLAKNMKGCRFLSLQHHGWSTNLYGFLGVVLSFINTEVSPWALSFVTLGVFPHTGSHTADATLTLIQKDALSSYDLSMNQIISSTQDTTLASFNVFNKVDDIAQIGCFFAHSTIDS